MASEKKKKKKEKSKPNPSSDSDSDDTFYYRYSSIASSSTSSASGSTITKPPSGSGTLAPSKSTLYVSNLDYSLTNSDLHTLFSTSGKIARVTVLKDRRTRLSRGVAFVQFVSRSDAAAAASMFDGKILNGRTLRASIAADNGRASEFIRKRVYSDKSRCYECGAEGHLSYECPRNLLGPRDRPEPKRERRKKRDTGYVIDYGDGDVDGDGNGNGDVVDEDNWASVVDGDADERLLRGRDESGGGLEKKKAKKASYFSDESGDEDE